MIGLVNTLIGFYLLDTGRNKPILRFSGWRPFSAKQPGTTVRWPKEKAAADNRLFRSGCGSKR